MEINEKEAWAIIGAIDTAQMEREVDEEMELFKKIRDSFPAINEELTLRELHNKLWPEEAEKDPRVKAVRKKLSDFDTRYFETRESMEFGTSLRKEWDATLDELQDVKELVVKELIVELGKIK